MEEKYEMHIFVLNSPFRGNNPRVDVERNSFEMLHIIFIIIFGPAINHFSGHGMFLCVWKSIKIKWNFFICKMRMNF